MLISAYSCRGLALSGVRAAAIGEGEAGGDLYIYMRVCIYIYICTYNFHILYVCIYIYIERERGREIGEGETGGDIVRHLIMPLRIVR